MLVLHYFLADDGFSIGMLRVVKDLTIGVLLMNNLFVIFEIKDSVRLFEFLFAHKLIVGGGRMEYLGFAVVPMCSAHRMIDN